jgi:hypothetical protein
MEHRTAEFLRLGLKDFEHPQPSPTSIADIVSRAQNSERARRHRLLAHRRALLRTYWLLAALVSAWILWQMPWPQWTPSALPERLAWLVPVLCAALFSSATLFKWLSALWARLVSTPVLKGRRS